MAIRFLDIWIFSRTFALTKQRIIVRTVGLGVCFLCSFGLPFPIQAEDGLKDFHYSYHHKLVDSSGKAIALSPKLVTSTQMHYINLLGEQSNGKTRDELKAVKDVLLKSKNISPREKAYIRSALIEVLLKKIQPKETERILEKSTALKNVIDAVFTTKGTLKKADKKPVSDKTIAYMKDASGQNGLAIIFELIIQALLDWISQLIAANDDYQNDCIFAGVPSPPDWGSSVLARSWGINR